MVINVLEWLEKSAEKYNDKIAYSDEESSLTFLQVKSLAQSIGSALIERGADGNPIAVFSGRSVMTVAAFLGVVYSGCSYAPIDSKLPRARIEKIMETLSPSIILTDGENCDFVKELGFDDEKIVLLEDAIRHKADDEKLKKIRRFSNENDPLYIIFTSGSTGNPKGVMTSHHSLMCYIEAYTSVMRIDDKDILGNQSPLDYIAAIRDIYIPLLCGSSTVIIPKMCFSSPAKLFDFMNEKKITSVGWSVSALTVPVSLGAFEHGRPEYLKKVCFSGSVMPGKCLKQWQKNLPDTLFVNQYGPTEATASCTYHIVTEKAEDDTVLPIGLPYKNYRVFLLNEDGTATKQGAEGEICVSGPILALGYYNDPERTAASFIQNPLNKAYNELIYKTGDIGVMREDGVIEFHGRMDRQIKHLGHRVELDEVELAAGRVDGVNECSVVYNKEKETIWLFYTGLATVKEIAVELRKYLPGFMVPRKIKNLEEIPRLPNGKIDINTLKAMSNN